MWSDIMEYRYKTKGTCSVLITFDINDDIITNINCRIYDL